LGAVAGAGLPLGMQLLNTGNAGRSAISLPERGLDAVTGGAISNAGGIAGLGLTGLGLRAAGKAQVESSAKQLSSLGGLPKKTVNTIRSLLAEGREREAYKLMRVSSSKKLVAESILNKHMARLKAISPFASSTRADVLMARAQNVDEAFGRLSSGKANKALMSLLYRGSKGLGEILPSTSAARPYLTDAATFARGYDRLFKGRALQRLGKLGLLGGGLTAGALLQQRLTGN